MFLVTVLKPATRIAVLLLCALFANTASADGASRTYLLGDIDWVRLLPTPPLADSAAQQTDIEGVIAMQKQYPASSPRGQLAIADAEVSCFVFADVLGNQFTAAKLPKTAAFFNQAMRDAGAAIGVTKRYWMRPRPYIVSKQVVPTGDMDDAHRQKWAAGPRYDTDHTSYPSGHATAGTVCGLLLARLFPEQQGALLERANTYRESRMVMGVHFRTDVEAGGKLGTALVAVMQLSPAFKQDEAEAAAEIKAVMGGK